MPKETVRYPDALVSGVEAVVAEAGAFESKSEFYRFASDFLLSVIDEGHEPTVLGYGDIVADLESSTDGRLTPRPEAEEEATGPFLDAYIQVRRHLLYDDAKAARAVVAERYDATDREALLLDEVIGRERSTGDRRTPPRPPETGHAAGDSDGVGHGEGGVESRDRTAAVPTTDGAPDRGRADESPGQPPETTPETDGGAETALDAEPPEDA